MFERQASCDLMSSVSFEEVVHAFLSERYRKDLEEYRTIIDKDPDYLTYHFMSTALKLQFQLKLSMAPTLNIGGCMKGGPGRCCVIDALKEAIERTAPAHTAVENAARWPR